MKRDAQATRQRILEAATAEFSRYGIAGARVDRIAAASGSNKSLIYVYFESKENLLRVVADELVKHYIENVRLDVRDLPEFAAQMYDQNQAYPEVVRLLSWNRLESGGADPSETYAYEDAGAKVRLLEQAQQEGVINRRLPPALLLEFIVALSQTGMHTVGGMTSPDDQAQRRQAIKDAVQRLVES
ncbi:TetR/AcrR family transcriptional regulator [Deinococcus sp. Arct2-2]|uniref:TetR family transcriptional regulator n=1 Tax=Deinococcus sp. Arct2-2 TaxID=2568653 RepID=UPI0010A379BD|nr:TetR family transcriptional regulator [Deinococcus sp. Arct2-2]THF68895.1 TetR/AcrR family transcriptional regulator [Deinococcus sp. Arct2-2]